MGSGMYKNRTFSTILIWAMRSFYITERQNVNSCCWGNITSKNVKELTKVKHTSYFSSAQSIQCSLFGYVLLLCLNRFLIANWVREKQRKICFSKHFEPLLVHTNANCVEAYDENQTYPNTFTHIQHDVSLWFSFVVHTTPNNKHSCKGHHKPNSLSISVQYMY